jgi:hypothetical protein
MLNDHSKSMSALDFIGQVHTALITWNADYDFLVTPAPFFLKEEEQWELNTYARPAVATPVGGKNDAHGVDLR